MILEYLKKLQALQIKAFEKGLNMEIRTRETITDDPWLTGHINIEGCGFVNDEEGTTYRYFYLNSYDFQTEEENRIRLDAELKKIEDFINNNSYEN